MTEHLPPSRQRASVNRQQRERRAKLPRVDYMPSLEAVAIMDAKRSARYPLNTNSGVLDAILIEWAKLAGIKYRPVEKPKTSAQRPELIDAFALVRMSPGSERSARAQESDGLPGITAGIAGAHARACESGSRIELKAVPDRRRVVCGAKRHRDGEPCRALCEPGKKRCRFHGGRSTGPKTVEGKAKALANLRQFRR